MSTKVPPESEVKNVASQLEIEITELIQKKLEKGRIPNLSILMALLTVAAKCAANDICVNRHPDIEPERAAAKIVEQFEQMICDYYRFFESSIKGKK